MPAEGDHLAEMSKATQKPPVPVRGHSDGQAVEVQKIFFFQISNVFKKLTERSSLEKRVGEGKEGQLWGLTEKVKKQISGRKRRK